MTKPTSGMWLRRLLGRGPEEDGAVAALVAVLLPMLLLAMALAVDIGGLLAEKAQLQRAVDAAALSAAETIVGSTADPATVGRQVLGANGVPAAQLLSWQVTYPLANTVKIAAQRKHLPYILPSVGGLSQFTIGASATADVNSYGEIPIEPTGLFGKVQQTNPAVFGPDGWRSRGNVYSTRCDSSGTPTCNPNPEYGKLPYGYLFRIDVPPTYAGTQLAVELFDPDSYDDPTTVTSQYPKEDTYVELNAFGPGWHRFHRVDELRSPYNSTASVCNPDGGPPPLCRDWATTTRYTLWHFDPHITNPFVDPSTIGTQIAQVEYGYDPSTDLKWVTPPGFTITLNNYEKERDGGWYFYLYVLSVSGSSENNFDIRTGPPGQVEETNVNDQQNHTWESGGTMVYAKRAYPMNNAEASGFTVYLTQVPANAAGQKLLVRHFDNDCSSSCSFNYYLETPTGSLVQIGTGTLSGNDVWTQETVQLPDKTDPVYAQVFPSGRQSAWLRAYYPPTIAQDTSVWEVIYFRPRLIQ